MTIYGYAAAFGANPPYDLGENIFKKPQARGVPRLRSRHIWECRRGCGGGRAGL